MSYNIHIVKGEIWDEEENPVTLDDVRRIMHTLPGNFRIVEDGVISMKNPMGQTISVNMGTYLEYTGEDGVQTIVSFEEGKCPSFPYQSDSQMLALCLVAETLGAGLVGDEGERYDREQLEKNCR